MARSTKRAARAARAPAGESLFPPVRPFVNVRPMRRAGPQLRLALLGACLLAAASGCGGGQKREQPLTFENLPDTTGLSAGRPILDSLQAERLPGGALRVHGTVNLPDGTRLQIAIRRPGERVSVAMAQMIVQDRRFDSPPLMGDMGPLPEAKYTFEVLAHFTPEWQSAAVLRATDEGRALRGPGITRTRIGGAMLWLVEDMTR